MRPVRMAGDPGANEDADSRYVTEYHDAFVRWAVTQPPTTLNPLFARKP